MKLRYIVGAELRLLREKNGWSQKELADKINVSDTTVSKVEAGKWSASLDLLEKFCDVLGAELRVSR